MMQHPVDAQFIPFLMELLALVARSLNPELSDRAVSVFAGNFIIQIIRAQPDDEPEALNPE